MELTTQAKEAFEDGRTAFAQGDLDGALRYFEIAHTEDPNDPTCRSYYGLCVGLAQRDFDRAVEICRASAKQEFFNPEQYLNLARLYLAFGFKSEGIRFLRRGQMIDPDHRGIQTEFVNLGRRVRPVLGFLPRKHVVNRCLGFLRHQWIRRGRAELVA